jgi:molybdate transport system substrate-binding protein
VVALVLPLAACGSGSTEEGTTLRVFAAASLTDSFEEIAAGFEDQHPGVTVELNLGPSSGLAEQVVAGAPADVFASASPSTMETVVEAELASDPTVFATNSLRIAVPPGNPGAVSTLEDLASPDVAVAVCEPEVPCGAVAVEVLDNAGLDVEPATEEVDVRSVLTRVTLDEVDAGLVYVTDVLAAGDAVEGIEIPAAVNAATDYPIAALSSSDSAELAQAFVDRVLSEEGVAVLEDAGFLAP